jgi:hypothetical protein
MSTVYQREPTPERAAPQAGDGPNGSWPRGASLPSVQSVKTSVLTAAVLSCLCLVFGSVGGAVAGSMVTGKQIKDGTVTGKDVKDGSLASADLADAAASGAPGPQGAPGAPGAPGPAGANGVSGYGMFFGFQPGVADNANGFAIAACPVGKRAVGGGGQWTTVAGDAVVPTATLSFSAPRHAIRDGSGNVVGTVDPTSGTPDAWLAEGTNHGGVAATIAAFVFCVNAS